MTLNIFTDFCSYWWLAWLLPFLLGLILGRLIWGKWVRKYRELEDDHARANSRINDLKKKLNACDKENDALSSEIRDYKHQLSTAKAKISSLSANQTDTKRLSATAPIVPTPLRSSPTKVSGTSDKYSKVSNDNLQIIEGIGPKMEQVLKENGIKNFNLLSKSNTENLKTILNRYGDKYKIIDPKDWTQQATLADNRKWDELMSFQKADGSESKAEKLFKKMGIIK